MRTSRPLLALVLAVAALAACGDPHGTRVHEPPETAPAADPVERAADAALRTLLDAETLISVVRRGAEGRLDAAQTAALDAWCAEVRAMAPAPPPLRYRLDPDRFDAESRTWPVDVALPTLGAALDAPATRLALVLEPAPGASGTTETFRIVESRLALR